MLNVCRGIAQLLHTGETLRDTYAAQLGLYEKLRPATGGSSAANKALDTNGSGLPALAPPPPPPPVVDDGLVAVYSTRYRRTFQSAMALLFGLVSPERWLALNVRESHSIAFCFDECVCPLAGTLQKSLLAAAAARMANDSVAAIVDRIGGTLLENAPTGAGHLHPMEVRDAVLAVLCHAGQMPCRQPGDDDRMAGVVAAAAASDGSTINQSDFINIDQEEETANNGGNGQSGKVIGHCGQRLLLSRKHSIPGRATAQQQQQLVNRERQNIAFETGQQQNQQRNSANSRNAPAPAGIDADAEYDERTGTSATCIRSEHVAVLLAHTLRLRAAEHRHADHRRIGRLRAYGLLRHIVANILKLVSGIGNRIVLYAGHDRTLEFVMAALGVTGGGGDTGGPGPGPFVPYAGRLAFEVYRSRTNGEHYVRIVYNGADVTRWVHVCAAGRSLTVPRMARRGGTAALCPIENIVRFIHDDYFAPFNTTNYREACQTTVRSL